MAESWIVVGNCFSMQKEHENALKFFNRAIQLDANNSYAFTLCGHEYAYNDDFLRAKKCFETALTLDIRSYSAWWGLGNLCYKQENYAKAAEHFQKAISVNSRCPILYSYLGMTFASNRDYQRNLTLLKRPSNTSRPARTWTAQTSSTSTRRQMY
jgi:anaphase-promoting complex subunit 3